MSEQMQAVLYEEFGDYDQMYVDSIEVPEVGEGEVLVRVEGAGINPVDAGVKNGYLKDMLPHKFPVIPGWDMTGVVERRGFSARRFRKGDEVYAYARRPVVKWGTFAEYVVIPESYLSLRPGNISPEEAGAIPLAGLTAYQSLYQAGGLQQDQTLLILGASGGVGSFAIQLAAARGARILAVASEPNHDYMEQLGADETIDYVNNDVGAAVRDIQSEGVDLIFDCTSGQTLEQSLPTLKDEGKLVSILNRGEDLDPDIDFEYVFVEPNSRQLDELRELVEAGRLNVLVSEVFSMEEAPEALKKVEKRHTRGKTVLTPSG